MPEEFRTKKVIVNSRIVNNGHKQIVTMPTILEARAQKMERLKKSEKKKLVQWYERYERRPVCVCVNANDNNYW